ncbi:MAG: hypothetical protein LBV54_05550 [Puniceicoccales bacterium]|jgi:hypothetical protein|nr:hypothetical protein [Puniceicoccales bacterium]
MDILLPHRLRQILESELNKGEQVIWVAQPRPWRLAQMGIPCFLFGIPWTGFTLHMLAASCDFKFPELGELLDFRIFSLIPFVLVGLGLLTVPLLGVRKAKKTVYAITTSRTIIIESILPGRSNIYSCWPSQLRAFFRKQAADGSGDLFFSQEKTYPNDEPVVTRIGFLGIPRVKEVELLLSALRGDAPAES